ncbi:dynamin GTPase effector domain protein, partial [Cooperia oncophora]
LVRTKCNSRYFIRFFFCCETEFTPLQQAIIDNKPIGDAIKDELTFLHRKYPTLASRNGTPYLAKKLNLLLMHHIRNCLPALKARVSIMHAQCQADLLAFGEPVDDKSRTLLQIITRFATAYTSTIEGTSRNIETTELCGGARICFIFHETFGKSLESVNPLENLTQMDILTAIRNATGPRPALFVPEVAFELLVKRQIQRLEEPSLRCVELVHEEMQRMVKHCGLTTQVANQVAIELAYINTRHPEFVGEANRTLVNAEEAISDRSRPRQRTSSTGERAPSVNSDQAPYVVRMRDGNEAVFTSGSMTSLDRRAVKSVQFSNYNILKEMVNAVPMPGAGDAAINGVSKPPMVNGESKKSSWWFGKSTPEESSEVVPKAAHLLPEVPEKPLARQLTRNEQKDCLIIERLIRKYFMIVRKNVQDSVPKAIMHFLVNYVRDNLQSELVRQLYKQDLLEDLLSETEDMAQRRKETLETMKALNQASLIISEVRETQLW